MKKILTAIAAALLFLPAAGFAGYVIHLKDGTRFVTDQYFEEGDQIKFKRYGGFFGIAKDRVREIEETAAPTKPAVKEETSAETAAPAVKEGGAGQGAAEDTAKGEVTHGKGGSPEEKVKDEQERKGRDPDTAPAGEDKKLIDKYTKEFDLISGKFQQVPVMTKEDLKKFVGELLAFRQGVLEDRLGVPFQKHLIEIYAMLDEVEAALKLRGH